MSQILLHTDAFTHRTILHTNTFTHRPFYIGAVRRGGNAVLRGRRAWHYVTFQLETCEIWWKLVEASYEMLVPAFQHVLSRFSGFHVAFLCQWGKLQNLSFFILGGFQRGCNVVSCGRCGTLWDSHVSGQASIICVANAILALLYLCVVFKSWVPFFVAGAALWRCPSSFFRGRRST